MCESSAGGRDKDSGWWAGASQWQAARASGGTLWAPPLAYRDMHTHRHDAAGPHAASRWAGADWAAHMAPSTQKIPCCWLLLAAQSVYILNK